jgi:hypothetical protein
MSTAVFNHIKEGDTVTIEHEKDGLVSGKVKWHDLWGTWEFTDPKNAALGYLVTKKNLRSIERREA